MVRLRHDLTEGPEMSADLSATTRGHRPVVLWAVPRSRSTAFERTFVERDDFEVLHEPFSATYYHSPERRSDAFLDGAPDPAHSGHRVLEDVLRPRARRVFVKDMAYHVTDVMDAAFVAHFDNSFMIRHPRETLVSLHRKHPTFTFEEAGFEQLARLYDYVTRDGASAPIVDADDLMRDPAATVRAYCAALDIPFTADALSWQPQQVDAFDTWDSWHDHAQHSTGLGEVEQDETPLPAELQDVYRRCMPHYERLRARVTPGEAAGG